MIVDFRTIKNHMIVWPITHIIDQHPGEIMLDIGANIGTITADMARKAAHVYAFEPHPDNLKELYARCGDMENVTIIEGAAGNRNGSFKLFPCATNPGGHTMSEIVAEPKTWDHDPGTWMMVKEIRGDDFVAGLGANKRVGLIKIDVEGYECQVLEGLVQTLKNHRPILALETHQTIDLTRLGELLKGYQIQGGDLKVDSAYVCI